jgi:diacylglycerol kinase family enzyme
MLMVSPPNGFRMNEASGIKHFLIANPHAGSGNEPPEVFADFHHLQLEDVEDAVAEAPEGSVIAVWGGDGTCRSVAQHTVNTGIILLPAPGGTFSHFAKEAGFSTIDEVKSGLQHSSFRLVDSALVNNELFLNNASIGWYVDLVARRTRYEEFLPRKLAKLLSVLVQVFRTRRLRIVIDGVEERVWMLWIGNGIYSSQSGAIPQREGLNSGVLDVRILRSGMRLPKLKALIAMLSKTAPSSALVDTRRVNSCEVQLRRPVIRVALDGELVTLQSPLRFQCRPNSLRIVTPS